jgi:hypothetical protein
MAELSESDLKALGIDTSPVEPSRMVKELKSFALGVLGLVILLGSMAGGCSYLMKDAFGKEVHETSRAQYEKRAREWQTGMPKKIPSNAANVRSLYCCWDGLHHYLGLQLGVTLPASEVHALLVESRLHGVPLIAPPGSTVETYSFLMDETLEKDDWPGAEKIDLRTSDDNSGRHFEGIAINVKTNRVIWFVQSDGG